MPDLYEPRIVVRIAPRNGHPVHVLNAQRVVSYDIDSAYKTPTDEARLEVYDQDASKLKGLIRQPIEIVVDGRQQFLGHIDTVNEGKTGSSVEIVARDYIADLVEDNVNPALKVSKDMSLGDAILAAFAPHGVTKVEGPAARRNIATGISVGNAAPQDFIPAKKLDEYKPKPGEGNFAYADRLAARHGSTIQPSSSRERVVLGLPDFDTDPVGRIVRKTDPVEARKNNVIGKPGCTRDWTNVPTVVIVSGKQGRSAEAKETLSFTLTLKEYAPNVLDDLTSEISDTILYERPAPGTPGSKFPVDTKPHFYRLLFHQDEQARNLEQLERVARRLMAERVRETLTYSAALRGHKDPQTGATYSVDTTMDVDDDVCRLHERLWVAQRTLSYKRGQGAQTKLVLWRLNTFSL